MITQFTKPDEKPPVTDDTEGLIRELFQVEHVFPKKFVPSPPRKGWLRRVWDYWFPAWRRDEHGETEGAVE